MTCEPQDHVLMIYGTNDIVCSECGFRWIPEQTTDDLLDLMLRLEPNSPGRKQVIAILKNIETQKG